MRRLALTLPSFASMQTGTMEMVVFDLEATGLSPYCEEIIQIAAMRMRDGVILKSEVFETFVNPGRRISTFITHYTGITNAQVYNAPSVVHALAEFSKFVGDATLVAHNGKRFDMPFIRETCLRNSTPVRPIGFIDSIAFSRRLWGRGGGHGLDTIISRLQLNPNSVRRHDARGDVSILAEAVRLMWSKIDPDFVKCPVPSGAGVIPV
jgi:DNA polymerase III alpha subunit (gram-positive type)